MSGAKLLDQVHGVLRDVKVAESAAIRKVRKTRKRVNKAARKKANLSSVSNAGGVSQASPIAIDSGAAIAPAPPMVTAYGRHYDEYLVDYQKYVEAVKEFRKTKIPLAKKSTSQVKPQIPPSTAGFYLGSNPKPLDVVDVDEDDDRVIESGGVPVVATSHSVWLTMRDNTTVGAKRLERANVVDDMSDLTGSSYFCPPGEAISVEEEKGNEIKVRSLGRIQEHRAHESTLPAPRNAISEVKEGSSAMPAPKVDGPGASKASGVKSPEVKAKVPRKRGKPSQRGIRAELKAVTLAANLATTLAKGEKAAARSGRSIVKTKDGWNLVLKASKPKKTGKSSDEGAKALKAGDQVRVTTPVTPKKAPAPSKLDSVRLGLTEWIAARDLNSFFDLMDKLAPVRGRTWRSRREEFTLENAADWVIAAGCSEHFLH